MIDVSMVEKLVETCTLQIEKLAYTKNRDSAIRLVVLVILINEVPAAIVPFPVQTVPVPVSVKVPEPIVSVPDTRKP